ncbi:hypothetical protein L228DRAFT_246887 [Xylona heveae TC161]|uniref:Uncharacterized protein n=1 Tax=Xylona heveae (strain CBS 132557 / TC161) TaxID=1328760 RepID=A0A165GSZ9_XYLHT|nr:hypothetical protein L228DRAFT_246887 [Xylona heveae TC161]KZF22559.1 hypothetical protein L228DRAFT_246887 [Xylona heveae TC161]
MRKWNSTSLSTSIPPLRLSCRSSTSSPQTLMIESSMSKHGPLPEYIIVQFSPETETPSIAIAWPKAGQYGSDAVKPCAWRNYTTRGLPLSVSLPLVLETLGPTGQCNELVECTPVLWYTREHPKELCPFSQSNDNPKIFRSDEHLGRGA